ncbi:hypothetical protein EVAR_18726_1 [Eumeta japonica]|uniref:Uncharacterized protein n=1 Tax=Eumeta variegata TaxID=151549 RepID=A0A4C1UM40_EUMVA|nr:hypothetical protein EVAR_18726_1 [Eumeta japonica]
MKYIESNTPVRRRPRPAKRLVSTRYEFVTPLTSLVVVKPNATSAVNAESVSRSHTNARSTLDRQLTSTPIFL